MSRIYYVEDDADIRSLVIYSLNMTGFDAQGFENSAAFRKAMQLHLPDLILLDVMLPGESGLDILKSLKQDAGTAHIPVMMITALGAEDDKIGGLENGADDYIAKPFGVMELIARIKALLRRCTGASENTILCCGSICMDITKHSVSCGDQMIQLALKEYDLLRLLMEAGGRLVDRKTMICRVWGENYSGGNHTLDAHMRTLRSKLGDAGSQIQTVYGRGYRLRPQN